MTWTGVSSALISSLAYFCGFETITVIHNLLVISMLICFYLMMKKQISNLGARENQAIVGAGIFTVMLIVIPAFELLSFWVISNTYCMVYIFLLMIGMNLYTTDERENKALLILLSMNSKYYNIYFFSYPTKKFTVYKKGINYTPHRCHSHYRLNSRCQH